MQEYERLFAASMKVLLQTRVERDVARKLDALVTARGCTRASYLAILVAEHVRDLDADTLRAAIRRASGRPTRRSR